MTGTHLPTASAVMAHDPIANCLRLVPGWQVAVKDSAGEIVITGYVRFHPYELGIATHVLKNDRWVEGRYVCWWDRDIAEAQRKYQLSAPQPFQMPLI